MEKLSLGNRILLLLVFSFLFLELLSRLFYNPFQVVQYVKGDWNKGGGYGLSPDRILGYEPVANRGEFNSLALRDFERYTRKKPANTKRILVVGDSVTYGSGVDISTTYPKFLEKLLEREGSFEVLNGGVEGYNTVQEVEWFMRHLRFLEPDVVILGYTLNDRGINQVIYKNQGKGTLIYMAENYPYFFPFPGNRYFLRLFRSYALFQAGISGLFIKTGKGNWVRRYVSSKDSIYTIKALKKIKNYTRSRGIELRVVIFPFFEDWGRYLQYDEHLWIRNVLDSLDITYLDLLEVFRLFPPSWLKIDRVHPSVFGHYLAALSIKEVIFSRE